MKTFVKLVEYIELVVLPSVPCLDVLLYTAERHLNIPQPILIQGLIITILAMLAISLFSVLTKYFVFYLYPSLQTIRVLQYGRKKEVIHWLSYWTLFSFVAPIEYYFHDYLSMIPFYYTLLLASGVWSYSPYTAGSIIIMRKYFIPIYRYVQRHSLDDLGSRAIDKMFEYTETFREISLKVKKLSPNFGGGGRPPTRPKSKPVKYLRPIAVRKSNSKNNIQQQQEEDQDHDQDQEQEQTGEMAEMAVKDHWPASNSNSNESHLDNDEPFNDD